MRVPFYIQAKVPPKALIDGLLRETRERRHVGGEIAADVFADVDRPPGRRIAETEMQA